MMLSLFKSNGFLIKSLYDDIFPAYELRTWAMVNCLEKVIQEDIFYHGHYEPQRNAIFRQMWQMSLNVKSSECIEVFNDLILLNSALSRLNSHDQNVFFARPVFSAKELAQGFHIKSCSDFKGVAKHQHVDTFKAAYEFSRGSGFGFLWDMFFGILIPIETKRKVEYIEAMSYTSFSIKSLHNSVYTDITDDPIRFAEFVLHECAHSLLNIACEARNYTWNDEVSFYSPYRNMMRPESGIAHAIFAFSIVIKYYMSILNSEIFIEPDTYRYIEIRIQYELDRLRKLKDAVSHYEKIKDPVISNIVLLYAKDII